MRCNTRPYPNPDRAFAFHSASVVPCAGPGLTLQSPSFADAGTRGWPARITSYFLPRPSTVLLHLIVLVAFSTFGAKCAVLNITSTTTTPPDRRGGQTYILELHYSGEITRSCLQVAGQICKPAASFNARVRGITNVTYLAQGDGFQVERPRYKIDEPGVETRIYYNPDLSLISTVPVGATYNSVIGPISRVTVWFRCATSLCVGEWSGRPLDVCIGDAAKNQSSLNGTAACVTVPAMSAQTASLTQCEFDGGSLSLEISGTKRELETGDHLFPSALSLSCSGPVHGAIRLASDSNHIPLTGVTGNCHLDLGDGFTGRYTVRNQSTVNTPVKCRFTDISGSGTGVGSGILIFEPDISSSP